MAISIDYIRPWTQLEATAGQTVFSTIWTADDATDILVYARASGVEARDVDQLVSSNDYTVQFIGAGLTVQVTFLVGRTLGDIITVTRDTPADKMNLYQNTNFKPSMLNSDFERVVMMIQQSELYDKDLSPRYNTSETPYGVDENNPPNFNRIIDLYLPLLPPLHVWRKNAENTRIEAVLFDGSGGGGGDDCCETTISQPTVDLELGDWVRFDTGTNLYVPAMANNATNADVVGMVKSIADASTFQMQQSGRNDSSFTDLTTGNYFLSATQPGKMSLSPPMNEDEVSVPVFAADSPLGGWVRNFRGKVLGDDANPNDGKGNGQNWIIVTQVGHGFSVEEALYVDASNHYDRAIASGTFEQAQVAGLVVEVIDADNFVLQQSGWTTGFSGKTAPQLYWLSDTVAGEITTTKPTNSTSYLRPCFIAVNTNNGWILERWQLEDDEDETVKITQVGHTFTVGQFVRPSTVTDGQWVLAQADSIENSTGVWMVIKVVGDDFWIQQSGITDKIAVLAGSATGDRAYLSATSAGDATLTEPTTTGQVSLPLYRLTDNSTSPRTGELLNYRPMLQPGANGGNGTSSYILLASQTVSGVTNIDFSTVFSANTGFRSYILRYEDVFGNSATTQRLLVQVYIGGVLQTSGYNSSATTRTGGAVDSPNTTAIQLNAATFSVYVGGSLAVASGGDLEFISPTTNGSAKICRGRGTFPINGLYGAALTHLVECSVANTANTSPYEGININSGGTLLLTGTFSVYGIV
jgi:hypothetical protein